MKKALEEAMKKDPSRQYRKKAGTQWDDLKGILKSEKDPVWLQHHAWDKMD
jgi:hypothetical protein